jgi:hypothetical protein
MRLKALGAIGTFLLCTTSCAKKVDRDPMRDDAAGAPSAALAAPANAKAPACEAATGTCVDDEHGEACVDGKKTAVHCAAGSICAAGACAPLGGRPADSFAAIGNGALVNRWSLEPHVQLHVAEAIERAIVAKASFEGLSERIPAPSCSASGAMPVPRRSSDAGTTYSMFKGTISIGRDGDVDFGMSVQGNGKLYLDGAKVFDVERDTSNAPMVDEDLATVHLNRGGHEVVVLVEEATAPMSFLLSARAKGGPRALLFAPGVTAMATCADAELADLGITKAPIFGGFRVDLRAKFHGLVPRNGAGLPISLELLTPAPHGRRTATEMVRAVAELDGYSDDVEIKTEHEANWLRASLGKHGEAAVEEPLLYRGDLHERIAKLGSEIPRIQAAKAPESARSSVEWDIQELTSALGRNDGDLGYLETRAAEAERVVPGVLEGKDPYVGRSGVLHKAYRSRLDGSLQPYLVNVPRKPPKGKVGYPVIFAIHGLNGEPGQALRTVVGLAPDREKMNAPYEMRHLPPLPTYNALIVAPDGYGNSGQRLPGEDDVLRVLEEIEAVYPVDPSRVTITGYSLGGTVSFVVPLHYPSLFAASGPLCGYPNFSEWPIIRDAPKLPWEEVLVARKSIVHYAENGMYLPLFMIHGGQDGPHRSRMMADRYHELGYRRTLDVQDDLDHDVWDYGYDKGKMVGWLRARVRPEHPKRLRFVTGEARYDQNRWVKVLGIADDEKFASVDAEWDDESKRMVVTTKNVAALALDSKEAGVADGAALVVDGKSLGTVGGEVAYVEYTVGAPARVEKEPSRVGKKRAGVAGPIDDVQRHAAIVVYGTQRADETEANRLVADHLATILHSTLHFPVKSDAVVTEDELANKSVILVGRPATNKITALFASSFPITFEANAVTVRKKRHEGADVGVAVIQPNPKNADEYLVLYAGVNRAGTLEARHLPQLVPDFIVYDKRITALREALTLGKVKVRDGGFFDASWK